MKYSIGYFEIFLAFVSIVFPFCYTFRNKNGIPTNWPLTGMLPALLKNHHKIHDYFHEIMEKVQLTFLFNGPWFTNMNFLATVDPANVHHILIKNFENYPKGAKLKETFEMFGDGILTTDSYSWKYHRRIAQSFVTQPQFHKFLVDKTWEKFEIGLMPILDHASKQELEIDLQDLFERFTFDTICNIIVDHDPQTLHIDLPKVPSAKALDDIENAILRRHVVPTFIWKLQRWFGVGHERKYKKGWENLDAFMYGFISKRREKLNKMSPHELNKLHNDERADFLTFCMDEDERSPTFGGNDDEFLRDTLLNLLLAGRDTTSVALSWLFYLLVKNPQSLSKINGEIDDAMRLLEDCNNDKDIGENKLYYLSKNFGQIKDRLVYLHGAICEPLRLYPPIPFESRIPSMTDILPSGHRVDPNMQIFISLYAMGRIKSIWGDDCCEFKPERWISEKGTIKHEPSYKFLTFNAGPRTCVGKNMAFTQMKAIAIAIISKYHFQPLQEHSVIPDTSIVLRMKHGFKAKVCNISIK